MLKFQITQQGLERLLASNGIKEQITHISVGDANGVGYEIDPKTSRFQTGLVNQTDITPIIDTYQHSTTRFFGGIFDSDNEYPVYEIGLNFSDGMLLGFYASKKIITYKSSLFAFECLSSINLSATPSESFEFVQAPSDRTLFHLPGLVSTVTQQININARETARVADEFSRDLEKRLGVLK